MKVVAHIGLHKTGTTSIQLSLAKNRDALLEQGILYPHAGSVEAGGHLNLVWEGTASWKYVQGAGGIDDLVMEAKNSKAEIVLISAESLSGYSKHPAPLEIVSRLEKELNAQVEIVCTVRPQFIMLDSLYAQNASTGYTVKSFNDYAIEIMNRRLLDFEFLLGRWFDRFHDVKLIPVEPGSGVKLENLFLSAIGIGEAVRLQSAAQANQRPSVRVVEYCRAAAGILASLKFPPLRKRAVLKLIREAVELEFPEEPPFSGLTKGFAKMIDDYYRAQNESFRVGRLGGAILFTRSIKDYRFFRTSTTMDSMRGAESLRFAEMLALAIEESRENCP